MAGVPYFCQWARDTSTLLAGVPYFCQWARDTSTLLTGVPYYSRWARDQYTNGRCPFLLSMGSCRKPFFP